MKNTYSAAIVGLGNIAWLFDRNIDLKESFLTHAYSYVHNAKTTLVGGYSPDSSERCAFRDEFGVPVFGSLEELISNAEPDIVSICSPSEVHFEQVMYCIERSVSMIWLEKPPTNSVREIDKLFEKLADRGGLCKVLVNYQRRYMESYRKLRTMYLEKKLGDCRLIQLNYSRGLQLNGSHILDTLFFIVGDSIGYELEWVSPFGGPENPCFALTLENGLGVMISGIALAYHCIDISLVCENGRASIMHGGMKPVVEEKVEHEWFPGFYRLKESENDYLGDEKGLVSYMKLALEDLINSYERSEEPQSNLQSARNAQELIEQVRHRQVN